MTTEIANALKLLNISKRYGSQVALREINVSVKAGQIHALLGENGAGKSTLVNIISGCIRPDSGSVELFGVDVRWKNPLEAIDGGIATVHQEGSIVPDLKVYDNFLSARKRKFFSSPTTSARIVKEALQSFGVTDVDPERYARELGLVQRQKLEIVRALSRKPKVLLLDEAFSALTAKELDWLLELLETEKQNGTTIVVVTHRLDEIREIYQEFTILRNGAFVGTYKANDLDEDTRIKLMLGRKLDRMVSSRNNRKTNQGEKLSVRGLSARPRLDKVDLALHASEIVGVAGLDGQGQLQLFNCLYGVEDDVTGTIKIDGREVRLRSPADAINHGIAYIPPNRREGLFVELSVKDNMALSILQQITKWGVLQNGVEREQVVGMMRRLEVKPFGPALPVKALSGGNQQKVLLGKWLLRNTDIIMLYDPTRGVDVGTKYEINLLIKQLADDGKAVLFYSSDVDEIVAVADRVLVFYRGQISEEIEENLSQERILKAMVGSEL